ncbi:hypothetical protein C8Q76DRAFT_751873 [Earliella scabrosa]|nr:hypothetical protein C8Q76DRAFT_751873 [Earliella scabrosa]
MRSIRSRWVASLVLSVKSGLIALRVFNSLVHGHFVSCVMVGHWLCVGTARKPAGSGLSTFVSVSVKVGGAVRVERCALDRSNLMHRRRS